jgi:hypothetical protein
VRTLRVRYKIVGIFAVMLLILAGIVIIYAGSYAASQKADECMWWRFDTPHPHIPIGVSTNCRYRVALIVLNATGFIIGPMGPGGSGVEVVWVLPIIGRFVHYELADSLHFQISQDSFYAGFPTWRSASSYWYLELVEVRLVYAGQLYVVTVQLRNLFAAFKCAPACELQSGYWQIQLMLKDNTLYAIS